MNIPRGPCGKARNLTQHTKYKKEVWPFTEGLENMDETKTIMTPDGAIYSRDMTTLYKGPDQYPDIYVVPKSVTRIENSAFAQSFVVNAVLHENVEFLGEYAFQCCKNLKSVTLPSTLIVIHKEVFWGCTALEKVVLPEPLMVIGPYAFANCDSLKKVRIPPDTYVAHHAFLGCNRLQEVEIPDIAAIQKNTFEDCISLERVYTNAKAISSGAFKNCISLTNVEFHGQLEDDGDYLYSNGEKMGIDQTAFYRCTKLKEFRCGANSSPDGQCHGTPMKHDVTQYQRRF